MTPLDSATPTQPALDRIYADPDTGLSLDLFALFRKRELDDAGYKSFLAKLPASAKPEIAKIQQLLADPAARTEADITTTGGRLAWAATLGFLRQTAPKGTIRQTGVWKALTGNPDMQSAIGSVARYLDRSLSNRNATMDWGAPGTWFYFRPDKNHVNIDLFNTLLLGIAPPQQPGLRGLPHATGLMMHEIGHAQLTVRWTDALQKLQKRDAELTAIARAHKEAPDENRKLTPEEFKELIRTRAEFKMRDNMMNAAEDGCVNRYAANQSKSFPHDFGASLNIGNVVMQGTGAYLRTHEAQEIGHGHLAETFEKFFKDKKTKEILEAQQAIATLSNALVLSFYADNGLFDAADKAQWKRVGIDTDKIKGRNGETFDDLLRIMLDPTTGLVNLQPNALDRSLFRHVFAAKVEDYADRRCEIIDRIWDTFAAEHAEKLLDHAEENADKKMDEKRQKNQQQQSDDEEQGGKGNDTGEGGGGESVDVDGVGEMDAGEETAESPEQARKAEHAEQDEENGEGGQQDKQTVRDLASKSAKQEREEKKEAEKAEKAEKGEDGKDGEDGQNGPQNDAPPSLSMDSSTQGGRSNVDLSRLARGDWRQFTRRLNELEPTIGRVTGELAYIRSRQRQMTRSISKEREALPRGGGDLVRTRLDPRAHANLVYKRASGQPVSKGDLERWKTDKVTSEPTSVELWLLVDGSGSMNSVTLDGGARPIDSAVQSMAILFEAGRRAEFDVFAGMWGSSELALVAKPGDSNQVVGESFERLRNGLNSGTDLSPSLRQAAQLSAQQETGRDGKPKRFAGMTHFMIFSDGDLNPGDVARTKENLITLFKRGPSISVDIAILDSDQNTGMHAVVEAVRRAVPDAKIGIFNATDPQTIPLRIAQQIKRRFEQSDADTAIPDSRKREAFSNAYKGMRP